MTDEISIPLIEFLAYVVAATEDLGWISGSRAYNHGGTSTAETAWIRYWESADGYSTAGMPIPNDIDKAMKIVSWVRSLDVNKIADNDFLSKAYQMAQSNHVTVKGRGYIAALVGTYDRAMIEETNTKNPSKHIGSIGAKVTVMDAVCTASLAMDGYNVNIFRSGHDVFVWSTQRDFSVGEVVTLTGTVKGHPEFRGVKQTKLTRCRVS